MFLLARNLAVLTENAGGFCVQEILSDLSFFDSFQTIIIAFDCDKK